MPLKSGPSMISAFTLALLMAIGASGRSSAQEPRHYSFGYDQPHTTGYGIAGDLFSAKLAELSHGSMVIDQFPGATSIS